MPMGSIWGTHLQWSRCLTWSKPVLRAQVIFSPHFPWWLLSRIRFYTPVLFVVRLRLQAPTHDSHALFWRRKEEGELWGVELGGSKLHFVHSRLPKKVHGVVCPFAPPRMWTRQSWIGNLSLLQKEDALRVQWSLRMTWAKAYDRVHWELNTFM